MEKRDDLTDTQSSAVSVWSSSMIASIWLIIVLAWRIIGLLAFLVFNLQDVKPTTAFLNRDREARPHCTTPKEFQNAALFLRLGLPLVSSAAVIRVVTQRFSPTSGGQALRDDPNNGCEGD